MSKSYIKVLSVSKSWEDDFTADKIYVLTHHAVGTVDFMLITTDQGEVERFPIMYCKGEGIDWEYSNEEAYQRQQYYPSAITINSTVKTNWYDVGNQLKPTGSARTGYAQVIGVGDGVYTLLTDFGNIVDYTLPELEDCYEPIGLIAFDDNTIHGPHLTVEERWNKQQELLAEAEARLISMGYFKGDEL